MNFFSNSKLNFDRVILIVLDSLGVGAARDAARFKDEKANTLFHIDEWCQKNKKTFLLPNLAQWGLNQTLPNKLHSLEFKTETKASTARLSEISPGKDTTTGHWEMAGTPLNFEFPVFEKGFSEDLLKQWCEANHLKGWLGNFAASGTQILEDLGEQHLKTGFPIVYTSGDSVFQVAAHEEVFGLQRLYDICVSARKFLDPLGVGRVIARPFIGNCSKTFKRTENRRDYSVPPPQPNMLDILCSQKLFVAGVGKIEDIFAHRSVPLVDHTGRNETSLAATVSMMEKTAGKRGLIFTNLIDFDQLHGHRRNPSTYADALMYFDSFLPTIENHSTHKDLIVLTADHGNDPTHWGTDHTREDVPLLFWTKNSEFKTKNYGELKGFNNIALLTLEALGLQKEISKLGNSTESHKL